MKFSPNNETNESQDSVQSIFSFAPSQSEILHHLQKHNINPIQFESQRLLHRYFLRHPRKVYLLTLLQHLIPYHKITI